MDVSPDLWSAAAPTSLWRRTNFIMVVMKANPIKLQTGLMNMAEYISCMSQDVRKGLMFDHRLYK